MDVLEALVRDTLAEHADDAPPPAGLLEAVTSRTRYRAGWLVAAAAVVVLAVGLVAALSRTHGGSQSEAGRSTSTPVRTITDHPLIEKTVAYHGVVLTVPGKLPVLTNACEEPASFVLADDPNTSVSCVRGGVAASKQKITVVLTDQTAVVTTPAHLHSVQQTIKVRGTDVMVTVTAPSDETVRRILASVRVAADPNGCPARLTAPSRRWVPGQSGTQLVRCVYASAGWLQASFRLRSAGLVAGRIAALPVDVNQEALNSYEHDLLRFSYPDGTTRLISVDLGSPSLFAAGRHVVRDVGNRVANLIRRLSN